MVIGIKKVELQGKVDPFRGGVDTKKKRRRSRRRSNRSQFEEHRLWPV